MKKGDQVVCVDASKGWIDGANDLQEGRTYHVVNMAKSDNGRMNIKVSGVYGFWDSSRFRKIDKLNTKEIAEEFEEVIERQIKKPELV